MSTFSLSFILCKISCYLEDRSWTFWSRSDYSESYSHVSCASISVLNICWTCVILLDPWSTWLIILWSNFVVSKPLHWKFSDGLNGYHAWSLATGLESLVAVDWLLANGATTSSLSFVIWGLMFPKWAPCYCNYCLATLYSSSAISWIRIALRACNLLYIIYFKKNLIITKWRNRWF